MYFIKGRFELGEPAIATEAHSSYMYATEVLKDRFELGEDAIAKDPFYSYSYAKKCLKTRFYIGEPIMKNSEYRQSYEEHFGIKL